MNVPHAELLQLASELAVKAGRMVAAGRAERGISDAGSKSSATDVVTEFDIASERLIVGGILAARPDDGIVGEEGTATNGTSGIDWLVDPIDGTTNFLYGLPGWAVSIAAATASGVCTAMKCPLSIGAKLAPGIVAAIGSTTDGGRSRSTKPST